MQRDHGLHAAVTQGLQNVPVMRQRRPGELAGGRLDPRPLHRQPMRILIQRSQEIKVAGVSSILLAGPIRRVGVFDMPGDLFPGPPVVAAVAALDLMCRRRRAP